MNKFQEILTTAFIAGSIAFCAVFGILWPLSAIGLFPGELVPQVALVAGVIYAVFMIILTLKNL